eukprot:4767924-Lingulodinium_polyedra.AAC.1
MSKNAKRRGSLDLTRFVHLRGVRQAKARVSQNPMWEMEMFQKEMSNKRGWPFPKSATVFNQLRATPSLEQDNLGWNGAERVEIPSSLLGNDFKEKRQEEYEDRQLETSSK